MPPLFPPSPLSPPLSVKLPPCPLQDEEALEELPEEEDATPARTSTSQEEVRTENSAAQVGQQQILAGQSDQARPQPVRWQDGVPELTNFLSAAQKLH